MNADDQLWSDVNVVASVLKLFLRKLPRCLLTPGMFHCCFFAVGFISDCSYVIYYGLSRVIVCDAVNKIK